VNGQGYRGTSPKSNAQAHLVRAAKMPVSDDRWTKDKRYETRNWSLFFFFRIMRQAEMDETAKRLKATLGKAGQPQGTKGERFLKDKAKSSINTLKLDLAFPNVLNGGLVAWAIRVLDEYGDQPADKAGAAQAGDGGGPSAVQGSASPASPAPPPPPGDLPAYAFRNWLKVLVNGDGRALLEGARKLDGLLPVGDGQAKGLAAAFGIEPGPNAIDEVAQRLAREFQDADPNTTTRIFGNIVELLGCIGDHYKDSLDSIRNAIERPAEDNSPHGYLARMILYEVLRQGAPLFKDKAKPVLRSEADEAERLAGSEEEDSTPITMAFSFPGLSALKIDKNALASFPDAFKEGMAARARRLGDVGRSAPEHWEGELGLRSVHGYFTGGSNLERKDSLSEDFWKGLRNEIRMFNDPTVDEGSELRAWIGLLFRLIGLEIVHIELGQDPYKVEQGAVKHLPSRVEHFGFRDGLSQPFVDLGLGDTLPGGGTADRRGTWSPVAPGEIFLDQKDETGQKHMLPLAPTLREGSTYLVFRKLEQDVEGFRAFLEQQRPKEPRDQRKLAAQLFGRWPNGTSLVHSPNIERSTANAETEAALNDFRYAADDPMGRKCPLGAHVRRANPRDIGGRNDVRHHRILRRGIAYGGPLLAEGQADDGERRGILFICANARIDLQFEVVQGDWLNGGEFLGQAGLGRCPISGAQDGSVRASFLEAGAVAPVTGLPSFVTMRGGDYFFAPGLPALKGIAQGDSFEVGDEDLPQLGYTMADAATPSLFSEDRLGRYWRENLGGGRPVRVAGGVAELPAGIEQPEKVTFVGRYDQVKKVLSNKPAGPGMGAFFSVEPYLSAGRRIARGEEFLVGMDSGTASHTRLRTILDKAWNSLDPGAAAGSPAAPKSPEDRIADIVRGAAKERLDAALRRTAGARRLDLVDDLSVQAAYGVLEKVFGLPGPSWLSELAGALPFSRQHVGDLPPDWIAAFKGERPADPGLRTMQVWSTFLVADLIGNYMSQQPLQAVARQAGSEMLNHIDYHLFRMRGRGPMAGQKPKTLIEAFVANERLPAIHKQYPAGMSAEERIRAYYKEVAMILLEIVGSTLAVIPLTFGSVMTTMLKLRLDLSLLLPRLQPEGVARIIYEGERLCPNSPIRFRRCMKGKDIGTARAPRPIAEGDFLAAVIATANMDKHVFWQPERFSLGDYDPLSDELKYEKPNAGGKGRELDNYLLFGIKHTAKDCWGRDRVAMPILEECIYACGRLQGLRKVAGPKGEPLKMGNVTIGLPARFTRILSKDVRET
jgi:deferrochelatase/peroxidase EfeB